MKTGLLQPFVALIMLALLGLLIARVYGIRECIQYGNSAIYCVSHAKGVFSE